MANLNSHNQDIHLADVLTGVLLLTRRLVNVVSQFCYANHLSFLSLITLMPAVQKPTLLINSDEIAEGQSRGFIIDDTNLFIVRHQGQVMAYRNSCPHRKVPLEWLPNKFLNQDKQFIQCSSHGALFTIEHGLCISGPCRHQSLTSLSVEERDKKIYCIIPLC